VIQHGANTTAPNGGEVMGGMPACPAPSTPTRSRSPRNCRPRSAGASTTHLIDAGALRGGPRRRRLWHGRRVSSGVERARACLGGRHPPSSEVYPREVELAFPSPGAAARANGMCPQRALPEIQRFQLSRRHSGWIRGRCEAGPHCTPVRSTTANRATQRPLCLPQQALFAFKSNRPASHSVCS
jgi:hypothetical protein